MKNKQENIQNIFAMFVTLQRFKTVAEHLNAEGHRTENEAQFTGQSVARILRDKTHLENGIISQELWDEVQAILAARKAGRGCKTSCRTSVLWPAALWMRPDDVRADE